MPRVKRGVTARARHKKVLDQAVDDGKLTQEEADAVAKASSAGIAEVRGTGGHGPR